MSPVNPDLPPAAVDALARRTGFSTDAVASMTRSVAAGGGRMAQFDHPEFGGPGQWMAGGMLMIADFSNTALRERVAQLCAAIAEQPATAPSTAASFQSQSQLSGGHAPVADRTAHAWWPASFGRPDTSGAQNDLRYAWFAASRRLAIDDGGGVTLYDTGDHRIGGVSQRQGQQHGQQRGGHRTLAFTSQHGAVNLASLPVVGEHAQPAAAHDDTPTSDPFQALEKLAALHARGIVADDEFARKKAELLARI